MIIDEKRELDKHVAEKYGEYGEVYKVGGELYGMVGMDLRTHFTLGPASSPAIEIIPHYSTDMFEALRVEKLIQKQGLSDEYIRALIVEGGDLATATTEQRCRAALMVPYVKPSLSPLADTRRWPTQTPQQVTEQESSEKSAEPPEVVPAAPQLPDDWWLTYYIDEHVPIVFYDGAGKVETVEATWAKDNIFRIEQTPLRVDGVSLWDCVEVRWEAGDLTPIFVRVKEKSGYRTIRADVQGLGKKDKAHVEESLLGRVADYRLGEDDLVLTYDYNSPDAIVDLLNGWNIPWEFADKED
jgi:hypothetical protein